MTDDQDDAIRVAEYVCGFAFTDDRRSVALIIKAKPEWQNGRINGIGGKIEPGETPNEAMTREFFEEAGDADEWQRFAVLHDQRDWRVHFFRGRLRKLRYDSVVEPCGLWNVTDPNMLATALPNLRWLIPMALEPRTEDEPFEIIERASASRPPAPAPAVAPAAALPEYPKCAPGPWGTEITEDDYLVLDAHLNWVLRCSSKAVLDFVAGKLLARLPAPSAAPVALNMSPEDAARLAMLQAVVANSQGINTEAATFLLRLLTDAHARKAEAREEIEALRDRVKLRLSEAAPRRADAIRNARITALTYLHDDHGIDSLSDLWLEAFDRCAADVYDDCAALRAQAGATGTMELTKEERERICDDYGMPASAIADDVLAALNRRTRPAGATVIPKVDPHEVSTCEQCDVAFIVERTRSLIAAKIPGARLEES